MAKILLVEDDKSLREIYGVRLQAEGYEIVSAGDGEEALAMAIKERPDLIVSDVMMPKISGFDMLDILRSTTETKDVKVIMMTALSSDDQRARGEALGADKYLVKSQVGIEDVVRTVHDVLGDTPGLTPAPQAPALAATEDPVAPIAEPTPIVPANPSFDTPTPDASFSPIASPPPMPPQPYDVPAAPAPMEMPTPPTPDPLPTTPASAPTPDLSVPAQPAPTLDFNPPTPTPYTTPAAPAPMPAPLSPSPVINMPAEVPAMPAPAPALAPMPVSPLPQPTAPFSSPGPASLSDRVINPISPQDTGIQRPLNMGDLMNQELASDNAQSPQTLPPPPPPPMPGQ
jgi:CheY-like chemotaxis protein